MKVIELKDYFKKQITLPHGIKLLNEMSADDASAIIGDIMDVVVKETEMGLGVRDCPTDHELKFFNVINEVIKEAAGDCFFCNPDIDVNDPPENLKVCTICRMKILHIFRKGGEK